MHDKFANMKNWQLFVLLALGNMLIALLFQSLIMTHQTYYNLLSGQLENYRIERYIEFSDSMSLWGILFIPVIQWIKTLFVTMLLQLPFIIKFVDIPFSKLYRVVLLAGFVLLLSSLYKFLWLYLQPAREISKEALAFVPLSITAYMNMSDYNPAVFGFLSLFNLFELAWIATIYRGIAQIRMMDRTDTILTVIIVWAGIAIAQLVLMLYISKTFGLST
ncbi:MAG: hypothetical protein ACM3SM_13415 [Bacteroidota bacterium]